MLHSIKTDSELVIMNCRLGSGIFDQKGKEIFEGDKIKAVSANINTGKLIKKIHVNQTGIIEFDKGTFWIVWDDDVPVKHEQLGFCSKTLIVM